MSFCLLVKLNHGLKMSSRVTESTDEALKTQLCLKADTVPVVGFHQPTAGAVLLAVHDRTEGVPDRWRSCLERSSI